MISLCKDKKPKSKPTPAAPQVGLYLFCIQGVHPLPWRDWRAYINYPFVNWRMNIQFEPVRWSLNTNLYEVNIRQYTVEGTFRAFASELPRLKDMGVKVLWFMPITPISWGGGKKRLGTLGSYYACSNYTDTNPEFGTVQDFRQLVKRAHELGMKVIIDWVANHTRLRSCMDAHPSRLL